MRKWSIVTKITASACGLVALLVIFSGVLLVRYEIQKEQNLVSDFSDQLRQTIFERIQQEQKSLQKNVEFNTTILSKTGAADLFNYRIENLKETLRYYLAYPEITAIRVLSDVGEPFAAAWKTEKEDKTVNINTGEALPKELALDENLTFLLNSIYDGQKVGTFQVYYTEKIIHTERQRLQQTANEKLNQFKFASHLRLKDSMFNQGVGILIILSALTFFLILMLRKLIRRPLINVAHTTKQLSDLDLTVKIKTLRRDEIGMLLSALHNMVEVFQDMVGQVQRSVIQVASSSTELSATAKVQEETMTSQLQSTETVLNDIGTIATVLSNLVQTMQEVAMMSEVTAEFATGGQTDLAKIGETMQRMQQASHDISDRLLIIRDKADSITGIVTTITQVADQTNLLSLNAAIEAEKAGESGLGFAVVASEIRRLADQTAVATLDIEQIVEEMQTAVSSGVTEMDSFIEEVETSVADVDKIGSQLNRIIEQVRTLTPNFDKVKSAMMEQSGNASKINEAMVGLSEELNQTTESFRETYSAIKQINEAARDLREQVANFKV